MNGDKPIIVALAGGSGSGKTTLSRIISERLPWKTSVIALDQFYKDLSHLTLAERARVNFDHPNSLDLQEAERVLHTIAAGRSSRVPIYDFTTHNRTKKIEIVFPTPVILVDGMLALSHIPLLQYYDLSLFLDIDEQTRWERKLERDMRERGRSYTDVLHMWETFTKPMHGIFVQPGALRANLLFTDSFAPQVLTCIQRAIEHRMQMRDNATGVLPE